MTIVERAIEKLRKSGAAPAVNPAPNIGSLVREVPAPDVTAAPEAAPVRLAINREAVREAGYLPETSRDRVFADYYRQIKRPLVAKAFAPVEEGEHSPRLIMMTSALPGDGKTFSSINLALSMARERDVSVVLVDADVLKPHVSKIFGVETERGLLDALAEPTIDVESLLLRTDVGSLSILPAGTRNEGATELLASARMLAICERLLARNPRRIVLFDSSPLLLSTESRALANVVGRIVLVVRSGATPREAVLDVLEELGEDKAVSLVLNQGRVALGGPYGYGDYGSNTEEENAPA